MPKWKLDKKDATALQGSWLGSIIDERGRIIGQTWRKTPAELEEWFSDQMTAAALRERPEVPPAQFPQPPAIPPKDGEEVTAEVPAPEAPAEEAPAEEGAADHSEDDTNETTARRRKRR
jgi:hypothetical protein